MPRSTKSPIARPQIIPQRAAGKARKLATGDLPDLTDSRAKVVRLEERPISQLRAQEGYVRSSPPGHVRSLEGSMRSNGFVVPVLITSDNLVIDGVTRLEAAQRAGMHTVPVIIVDGIPPKRLKLLSIRLNREQEKGEWNLDNLRVAIQELICDEIDLAETGFEVPETDFILGFADPDRQGAIDQTLNRVSPIDRTIPPTSQLGDLWLAGSHRIYCGSALDAGAYNLLLGNRSAALIVTDPPYNVPIKGHVGGKGRIAHDEFPMASGEMTGRAFTEFLLNSNRLIAIHLRPGGLVYMFMDWRHMPEVLAAAEGAEFELINLCVWVKPNGGMGSFYRSRHELVFVLRQPGGAHRNNIELGKHGRNRTNVWEYEGVNTLNPARRRDLEMHPTVKPVEMIADAILDASAPGDVVLDPFLGSGTAIIAGERTGRHAYGIELDPYYVDVAIRRWQEMTGQSAIHAETGRSFDDLARPGLDVEPPEACPAESDEVEVIQQLNLFPATSQPVSEG